MKLSDRAQRIEPFYVMEVAKAAAQMAEQVAHTDRPMIYLNIGEPDFTAPPLVQQAAERAIRDGRSQYTQATGLPALREAISGWYASRFGLDIDPARIVVTAGASAALQLACLALVERGAAAVVDNVVRGTATGYAMSNTAWIAPDTLQSSRFTDASNLTVRSRIKELIDAEQPAEVLSDDRIVEILNEDGTMARRPELEIFAAQHGLRGMIGSLHDELAALGSLVAGMAHELNTPIGNVLAVASTLTEDAASFSQKLLSGSARRGDVEKGALRLQEASVLIERNATRAAKLISDFKEVAVDQTSSRRRLFPLLEVMQEILHTTQPLFKGKGHTVTLDIPPDLELDSYPGPLEQIMTNLLTNSVHHAFAADGAGDMVIRAESQGEQILLHYRDNGCGIPPANLAHIFEPFYTTKLGKGGSGLGMYLVYNLVSNVLGGRIQVQSPPGEGTWVDITIPRTAPDVATNPLAKGVSQPGF